MEKVIHRAATRGYFDHGWLQTFHTFSFADYYNPQRIHFGALRVLNDDTVAGGEGFGSHPHDNMEIVSIPLSGELRHEDSMGHGEVLRPGEIQVMSAGTGIVHSEFNNLPDREVKFLQIWIFPDRDDLTPRYEQIRLAKAEPDRLRPIVAPKGEGGEHVGWIHQKAWLLDARPDVRRRNGLRTARRQSRRLPLRTGRCRRSGRRDAPPCATAWASADGTCRAAGH